MILADTSVWVDHLRRGDERLSSLLHSVQVLIHPFVVGEIALRQLRRRDQIVGDLQSLPHAQSATDDEVLRFIDGHALAGAGIGYVDAHLLAATKLTAGSSLWTRDRRLRVVAERLSLAADLR